ncbi:MAG: oligopeptide/dipeptide transporter, ATPase subunit [Acidimicrobiales bacterium]|nr:oligopeptide/dipeptide transporter, ATPase subunit [Acidimicrobiales bacterium]
MTEPEPLLSVRDLRTHFHTDAGVVKAVDGVSFDVMPGEVFGIVGESGSGKSITAMSILGLVPMPPGRIESGEILWKGTDLLSATDADLRRIRGKEISMIFQDPMTSLNPVYTIGQQIAEIVRVHNDVSKQEARDRAIEMLELVGIPRPEQRANDYPHQFSGGMRQRAMIAMAIACDPDLLIADEPTTALDVTIQAQILEVLQHASEETNSSIILITHDLGVVAGMADRVAVMYAGQIVETGAIDEIFYEPRMPYTWGLLESIPRLDQRRGGRRLQPISGSPPSMLRPPSGCRFHPRCPYSDGDRCVSDEPSLIELRFDRQARCHYALQPGWYSPGERLAVAEVEWDVLIVAATDRSAAPDVDLPDDLAAREQVPETLADALTASQKPGRRRSRKS